MSDAIRMRQRRSFGELLNVSFHFARTHFRILVSVLLRYVLPILIVVVGLVVMTFYVLWQDVFSSGDDFAAIGLGFLVFFLALVLLAGGFALAFSIYLAVIRLALQKGNDFSVEEIKNLARENFWRVVGMAVIQSILTAVINYSLQIPMYLLFGLGVLGSDMLVVVLFLQFVLFAVVFGLQIVVSSYMSLSYPVMLIERRAIFESIQRSYRLVKGNFKQTIAIQFTMSVIVYCMSMAPLVHPLFLAGIVRGLLDPVELSSWFFQQRLVVLGVGMIYGLFVLICLYFIWSLNIIVMSFQYLNIVERREGVGLALRINSSLEPVPADFHLSSVAGNESQDTAQYSPAKEDDAVKNEQVQSETELDDLRQDSLQPADSSTAASESGSSMTQSPGSESSTDSSSPSEDLSSL